MRQTDYTEARACLVRLLGHLDVARREAGRTNLPPALNPQAVRRQIDALDDLLGEAQLEVAAARQACIKAGRHGLRAVD